jgi:NAD(P)-dependent dehydrogenase (short-subunit alcohol dehydrogenase family)
MPTLDQPWTEADYAESYDGSYEPFGILDNARRAVRLGYHRHVQMGKFDGRWTRLAQHLSATPADAIAVVGAPGKAGAECAAAFGLHCCSCDSSAYIQTHKGLTEEADLRARMTRAGLDPDSAEGRRYLGVVFDGGVRTRVQLEQQDLRTKPSRTAFRQAFAVSAWTHIVSEDVLTCLTDATVLTFCRNLESMMPSGRLVHLVTPLGIGARGTLEDHDPGYNWKTLDEWRAFFDANGLGAHQLTDQIGKRMV